MTIRVFRKRFQINVPARGWFGGSPKREATWTFVLPDEYRIVRGTENQGAKITKINLGGLREVSRDISKVDNGVKIEWTLSNGKSVPLTGRIATIDVELTGEAVGQMSLSAKYQAIRQRFFDQFFFDGIVAEYVDLTVPGKKVKFADQTLYLGQALIALATEAAILRATGGDVTDTNHHILTLMNAINRLDLSGEAYLGETPVLDGFFVRDDVIGPSDPRLNGRFAKCQSDFQNPDKENASPSGDQIFGMMYGLSAVVHFCGEPSLISQAREISSRLYDYARRNYFVLRLPNGHATRRGSDMRWLASLMHGLNEDITGQNLWTQSKLEILGQKISLGGLSAFWRSSTTADLIAGLAGRKLHIPIINDDIELKSFALHILLMAIAPVDVWSQEQLEKIAIKLNHHASMLLYCARHSGSLPIMFDRSEVQDILAACPATGPAASLPADSGWNHDNRWVRSSKVGSPSEGEELYNGLDWMILHNLDQLVFVGGSGPSSVIM